MCWSKSCFLLYGVILHHQALPKNFSFSPIGRKLRKSDFCRKVGNRENRVTKKSSNRSLAKKINFVENMSPRFWKPALSAATFTFSSLKSNSQYRLSLQPGIIYINRSLRYLILWPCGTWLPRLPSALASIFHSLWNWLRTLWGRWFDWELNHPMVIHQLYSL